MGGSVPGNSAQHQQDRGAKRRKADQEFTAPLHANAFFGP
jgi:hypothetical protein